MAVRLQPASIQGELARFVLVIALPLVALVAYVLYERARHDILDAEASVLRLAQGGAEQAARFVAETSRALEAIARRPLVRALDPARCDPGLRDLLALYPRAGNFLVVNREGRIICGAIPPPRNQVVRIRDEALLAEVLSSGRFALSRPIVGRINKRWAVAAVQPVSGEDGRPAGTVSMSIDLASWQPLRLAADLPPGTIVSLVSEGVVIARSEDAERWVGRDVSGTEIMQRIRERAPGVVHAMGVGDVERIWGFQAVRGTPWTVLAGLPAEAVYAPVRARSLRGALLVALVIAAALALAFLYSRRLARPIREISAAVRARTEGAADAPIPVAGPREIAEVAAELNRSSERSERMAREREELLARMQMQLERMPIACVLFDADLRITDANPAAERTFGWSAAEMRGGRAQDLYVPPERRELVEALFARLRRGEFVSAAGESVRRDGTRVALEWVNTPLLDAGGAFLGLMSMATDITEREAAKRRLEAFAIELEQRVEQRTAELAAANQELEAFSYSVSHDLRAPVRHIDGFARLLSSELPQAAAKPRHYLDTIIAAARRMGALIDDLLELSRTGRRPLSLERVELAPLVREVIHDAAPEIGARRIEWTVGELPAVMADPALVKIVLQNLVSNALKYTRPRAVVRIAIEARTAPGGEAEITVRDNGVGFDARFTDKLFGVFQRLHRDEEFEGTGIGLATARRIVHRHGQRIWARGEADQGAAFTFTLAQCEAAVTA